MRTHLLILILLTIYVSCAETPARNESGNLYLLTLRVGDYDLLSQDVNQVPVYNRILLTFSCPVDATGIKEKISLFQNNDPISFKIETYDNNQNISLMLKKNLREGKTYRIILTGKISGVCNHFNGFEQEFRTRNLEVPLEILSVRSGTNVADPRLERLQGLSILPDIKVRFSEKVSLDSFRQAASFTGPLPVPRFSVTQLDSSGFRLDFSRELAVYRKYQLVISENLVSEKGNAFQGIAYDVYTNGDTTRKFPEISDEALLTKIQRQTFTYFWDFGHPVSGLARERITSGETVTSGGSGFAIMAIIVGIERGFITRSQGIERMSTMVNFLKKADRFHGAWSHWLNGTTGRVIPFSQNDDGGDLVETSYVIQGLLTFRQYLDSTVAQEKNLMDKINLLWHGVEWDWYTRNRENVLYWHWSPNYGWEKNHQIRGYHEALITYICAASSPSHGIEAEVYHQGWARGGDIINGNSYYGYELPLGNQAYGGPLFFEHYTYLGIDPRHLSDNYADYWKQGVHHTLINRAHCIINPNQYIGYHENCWGLTASDGNNGYSAHSPTNDRGVITPTAAISSIVYTPEESMDAIHHFYYILGDKLWGDYGFYDAFNLTEDWWASSYLAIDQGPIVCMIENYRTGLLWELFMSAPEIQNGLTKLGFSWNASQ